MARPTLLTAPGGLSPPDHLTPGMKAVYDLPMVRPAQKYDRSWRKSRIAARLLYRRAQGPLGPRDRLLAEELSRDPEVENRLIQQALYYLGGARKHELDRQLVAWGYRLM